MSIRPATPADYPAIREVVAAAFGQVDEADLVEALRAEDRAVLLDLVAEEAGEVVGHIMFSRMTVTPPLRFVAGMAPVAVKPGLQNGGYGSQLCSAGIEACRGLGVEAIVVLGHPAYYPRFGFSAEVAKSVASPFGGRASWMAMELIPGALAAPIKADYPAAFG